MTALTKRQQELLEFIENHQQATGQIPSLREMAAHFGFRSATAAADHLKALKKKGYLESTPRQARSWQVRGFSPAPRLNLTEIPIYGSIPAGLAEDRQQEQRGCVTVDLQSLGIRPSARTFALEVRGDSMIGKHIVEGDIVILEHGRNPLPGDVVAALIDNESTLKTFLLERGKPFLKAENPKYPKLIPAQELVIQGVMVALVRKKRG